VPRTKLIRNRFSRRVRTSSGRYWRKVLDHDGVARCSRARDEVLPQPQPGRGDPAGRLFHASLPQLGQHLQCPLRKCLFYWLRRRPSPGSLRRNLPTWAFCSRYSARTFSMRNRDRPPVCLISFNSPCAPSRQQPVLHPSQPFPPPDLFIEPCLPPLFTPRNTALLRKRFGKGQQEASKSARNCLRSRNDAPSTSSGSSMPPSRGSMCAVQSSLACESGQRFPVANAYQSASASAAVAARSTSIMGWTRPPGRNQFACS